jgi:hypothetical protein
MVVVLTLSIGVVQSEKAGQVTGAGVGHGRRFFLVVWLKANTKFAAAFLVHDRIQ